MPFNSDTYHANKCRAEAWKQLAAARAARSSGNLERAQLDLKAARSMMRLAVLYRREARDRKDRRKGK